MNFDNFNTQVDRLKFTYGEKNYPEERLKLLWQEIKDLEANEFEKIVDHAIAQERHAPLIDYFIGKRNETKTQLRKTETQSPLGWEPPKDYQCDYCFDRGTYLALNKNFKSGPYAFRCHCRKGSADERVQIPQFKALHAEQGFYWIDPKNLREGMEMI